MTVEAALACSRDERNDNRIRVRRPVKPTDLNGRLPMTSSVKADFHTPSKPSLRQSFGTDPGNMITTTPHDLVSVKSSLLQY
ncbi:uncharacterized protein BKA55DRAFT_549261 [Fusarium redolens]|uniref:Uncharacterized protein n=1 Tax=Fusarium redolens TaxID=48865 RepID=A0A9P9R8F8_FUSRE|nr:uncharacterized protein BKA55DRAFT_549261 [Fusarium redolens]KAH7269662.1 hypothetical protein BKA55DRAFT_549261 [Fusarium redolens]